MAFAALQPGKPRPFQCSHCTGILDKFTFCSNCRSSAYCDRDCQQKDWAAHKKKCPAMKKTAGDCGEWRKNSPTWATWASPACSLEDFQAAANKEVLSYGFSAVKGGPANGGILSGATEWPSEVNGWQPIFSGPAGIPHFPSTADSEADRALWPAALAKTELPKDFPAWLQWRGLDSANPASFLMNFPLSLYHCIRKMNYLLLKQELTIHLLGVERELNLLPLYGELALLLPIKKIRIILFGPGMSECRAAAEATGNSAVLGVSKEIFRYSPPEEKYGERVLTVEFAAHSNPWGASDVEDIDQRPHLVFAHNAGLGNFSNDWRPVFSICLDLGLSFACTEMDEASILTALEEWIPQAIQRCPNKYKISVNDLAYRLNHFRCPAQKGGRAAPTMPNGFIFIAPAM